MNTNHTWIELFAHRKATPWKSSPVTSERTRDTMVLPTKEWYSRSSTLAPYRVMTCSWIMGTPADPNMDRIT